MKILTICQKGNSRSVALGYLLKKKRHDTLAMGMKTSTEQTRNMLYDWAELIILLAKRYEVLIPSQHKDKLIVWDIKDYFNGHDERLINQLQEQLKNETIS